MYDARLNMAAPAEAVYPVKNDMRIGNWHGQKSSQLCNNYIKADFFGRMGIKKESNMVIGESHSAAAVRWLAAFS